ncbi:PAS domain S-box protein [Natrialba sp. INN-245]|uniref:PAS domain S-box protein n=1 Tax=Natrialba sp. INN-245 TaxID=2690967 RepID=UPI00130F7F4F|nr:PAS domain S-box protein [Natrialba sp. INN-245]MWV40020.1 PAS domain S-box protein [Natrialba sp. INN-245]
MERHVLYVDFDVSRAETATHLEQTLPETQVSTAATARDGLASCVEQQINCVVSAYELPEANGVEFLESVREEYPTLPFILFPAAGSEDVASDAISAGVTDYVQQNGYEKYTRLATSIDEAIEQHHSRTKYEKLFDAIDDAIIIHDPDTGDIIDVNRAVCHRWGYAYDDACECDVEELSATTQPATGQSARALIKQTVEEGPQRIDWLCETNDGKTFWADIRLKPVTIDGQQRVVALIRDITEKKHREQELEAFREAVEHAGHAIYITDMDGEIQYVNPAFEEATGYSVDEAIGNTPKLLKSGEHDTEFYEELWETILDGDVWQSELINEHKDGSRYTVNQTIAPITNETDEIVRFVAVNAGITERKRRERQLQTLYRATTGLLDAESKDDVFEFASEQLADLLEFDLHGFYQYNESARRLEPAVTSEYAETTLDEKPVFEEGEGIVWTAFESGESKRYDDVRTHPDIYNPSTTIRSELLHPLSDHGVLLISSENVGAFDDTDETLTKVLASGVTEVLNRIDRENDLQKQNSRLEEFASVVSHDLRNPLTVANGNLELAQETGDDAYLDEVAHSHSRMERIIDDLLWLAHEGRKIGETRPVELSQIVDDAWRHVGTKHADMIADCDRIVEADPSRLQQLLENLFRNAIEHAGEDATVRVGFEDDGWYVEDDGPGIPDTERQNVFDAGYSTEEGGTGFGLAIVQTIADAHGWDIALTDGMDGGARFEFRGLEFADRKLTNG